MFSYLSSGLNYIKNGFGDQPIKLITHNGTFQCDEVTSYSILSKLYPNHKLIRTRDEEIIKTGDIVFDIGYEYNHENKRYDHHQSEFNDYYPGCNSTPMSSAGLIWFHYGKQFVDYIMKQNNINYNLSGNCYKTILRNGYNYMIQEIDGIDNGVNPVSDKKYINYNQSMNLSNTVSKFNLKNPYSPEQDIAFLRASEYVFNTIQIHLLNNISKHIDYISNSKKFKEEFDIIKSSGVKYFYSDTYYDAAFSYLNRYDNYNPNDNPNIFYVVAPKTDGTWSVQCRKIGTSFNLILPLVSFEDITNTYSAENDIISDDFYNDFIFVHKKLFTSGFKTKKSAMEFAELCLDYHGKI